MLVLNQQSAPPDGQQKRCEQGTFSCPGHGLTCWARQPVTCRAAGWFGWTPLTWLLSWVLRPIRRSTRTERAVWNPLSSLSEDMLTAEQRAEENILFLFLSYSQRPHNIPKEAGWSSHGCSVPDSLNCTGGQQERGMKRTFVPCILLTFSVLLLFDAVPKRSVKEPSFHVSLFMRVIVEGYFFCLQ